MRRNHNINRRRGTRESGKKSNKCLWALFSIFWCVFLYKYSEVKQTSKLDPQSKVSSIRKTLHDGIEAVAPVVYDLVGYGSHSNPRVAAVIVSSQAESGKKEDEVVFEAIQSLMEHTDRNRIFVVCAVLVGQYTEKEKEKLQKRALDINEGKTLHWHGDNFHSHSIPDAQHDIHHSSTKIHINFLEEESVDMARRYGAEFVDILRGQHLEQKIMDEKEKLLLLLLRSDARFLNEKWLDTVSEALMPSSTQNIPVSAVSLSSITDGQMLALNDKLDATQSTVKTKDMMDGDGKFYSTPILLGPASVIPLDTFIDLIMLDVDNDSNDLDSHFAADVHLSLALWLCQHGIHVLRQAHVEQVSNKIHFSEHLSINSATKILSTWIKNNNLRNKIAKSRFNSVIVKKIIENNQYQDMKELSHCKSFDWFIENVNTEMKPLLIASAKEKEEEFEKKRPESLVLDQDKKKEEKEHDTLVIVPEKEKKVVEKKKPMVELREINKDIVNKPKTYTLEYVDAANGFKEHPHLGARDANGKLGFVHDETALSKQSSDFIITPDEKKKFCGMDDLNKKMLTEQVYVDITAHQAAEKQKEHDPHFKRAKIFCTVYTISKNHNKLQSIFDTWGPKCDGFMVASDKTDPNLHTVDIIHEGKEEYNNIWQKVRSIWAYVYDNYYEKYDWFHIGGDDLYLLVENLRLYLESEEILTAANGGIYLPDESQNTAKPLFLGRRFKEGGDALRIFNSGGSGYTLNKAALKALVVDGFPTCMTHLRTFAEDVMVAQCLRNKINVFPYDTKDENGSERYMPFQPGHHYGFVPNPNMKNDWYIKYSIDVKWGREHCAKKSVAFHYIDPQLMRRMHALLYGQC